MRSEKWCTSSAKCKGFDYFNISSNGQKCGKSSFLGWLGCADFKDSVSEVTANHLNTLFVKPPYKPGKPGQVQFTVYDDVPRPLTVPLELLGGQSINVTVPVVRTGFQDPYSAPSEAVIPLLVAAGSPDPRLIPIAAALAAISTARAVGGVAADDAAA